MEIKKNKVLQKDIDQELSTEVLEQSLYKIKFKKKYFKILKSTFYTLIVVAAVAALLATLLLPVVQIFGESMSPTLNEKEIIICVKDKTPERGDIYAFYYNNKILVKRIVGCPGDTVAIDEGGDVYINGELLSEEYITGKSLGECDIEFPYKVNEGEYFVIGDNREVSLDSRLQELGCVPQDQLLGKLYFRVWPVKGPKKI